MSEEILKNINFNDLFELPNLGILVVDMQTRFVNRIFSEQEEKLVIGSHEKVLSSAVKKNIPTCLVEYCDIKAGKTIPEIYDLVKKIENNLYITKSKNSAFYEPLVHQFLKSNNVENLIIMGFHANLCLKTTTEDAISNGFSVFTSENLFTDYDEDKKLKSLDFYNENCNIINFS